MKSFIQYILCDRIIDNIFSAFDILSESTQNRYKKFSIKIRRDNKCIGTIYVETQRLILIRNDYIEYVPMKLVIKVVNNNDIRDIVDIVAYFRKNGCKIVENKGRYDVYNASELTMSTYTKYISMEKVA
jgi:hypothetical protein